MNKAIFLITTARSGTQWLADSLERYYSDLLVVKHEPIGYAYRPKIYLRNEIQLDELRAIPEVSDHLDDIHRILESKSYIETGFPCYALAPLLVREFGQQLHFVHMVRHPVHVAASVTTHNWYGPKPRGRLTFDVQPDPFDAGVIQKDYSARWPKLSPYEKALFYWTEVHLFGMEVETRFSDVPFHRVRFEELLSSPSELMRLTSFLDLPFRNEWRNSVGIRVDRFRSKKPLSVDWTEINRHPKTVALGKQLGYDLFELSGSELHARHNSGRLRNRFKRAVRKGLRFVRELGHRR